MSWAAQHIDKFNQAYLLRDARDYALTQGLVKRLPHQNDSNILTHYPINLLPTPFPVSSYKRALDLQPIVNELYCKIANDFNFIQDTLLSSSIGDEFVGRLLNVHKTCVSEGLAQTISCCISRSDYMLERRQQDDDGNGKFRLRQVEVNTIAAGLPAPCHKVQRMHHYLMTKYDLSKCIDNSSQDTDLCKSLDLVERALIEAFNAYNKASACIIFVTEDRNWNFSDYFHIELAIFKQRPDIFLQRVKFSHMHDKLCLGPNKELLLKTKDDDCTTLEVAVVYFRTCYDPEQFCIGNKAWNSRLLIERSRAIKCPPINYHIAGAKKFQQVLNTSQQLQRYLDDAGKANKLASSFCQMWPLDQNSIPIALNPSNNLVLKPQREGGGNNIYGSNVAATIKRLTANIVDCDKCSDASPGQSYKSYILMERIKCVRETNWFLDPNDRAYSEPSLSEPSDVSSELGIFGLTLADGLNILRNEASGYLLRSKKFGSNEGGVSNGSAAIGSLLLLNDDHELFR